MRLADGVLHAGGTFAIGFLLLARSRVIRISIRRRVCGLVLVFHTIPFSL